MTDQRIAISWRNDYNSATDIYGRIFDHTLTPTSETFIVNVVRDTGNLYPGIFAFSNGDFIVVFSGYVWR